jgi:GTP cyclohydrolase I
MTTTTTTLTEEEYNAFLDYRAKIDAGGAVLEKSAVDALFGMAAKAAKRKSTLDRLEDIGKQLINAFGEDLKRPGLIDTPARFARMWDDFINYDPGTTDTVFEGVVADQMVVVSGMPVWSMCEHHLLPMRLNVSIGLSKYARIAHKHAHKLQIQERYVKEVADEIEAMLGASDVAVVASGIHLCMEMRGIRTHGIMTSSVMRGAFQAEGPARAEFLALHHGHTEL